ncbi:MAG: LysR family transcriptional regulator [Desulfocapsa sp.]|nr:LysR family transcriptional regulator [Desulfocapsa sp.]
MSITFRHLQQIKILARRGNFAKAARDLNISQPALSRSISSLEEQLGVQLFDRSKREVVCTVFGKHILERGKPLLQDMEMMERDLNLLQGLESGKLVIGSGPFPAEISVGKAVARFSMNYPKVNVRIVIDRTPNLLPKLYSRELDIFVADTRVIKNSSDLEIIQLPMRQAHFCCLTNHPLTEKKQLVLKDIFSYPLAVMWVPKTLWELWTSKAGLQSNDVTNLPCAILECDYLKVLLDIVAGSNAVGLVTNAILDNSHLQQQLALLPLSLPELNTHYGLVTLSRYSQSPVVQMFQDYMIEIEKECSQGTEKL